MTTQQLEKPAAPLPPNPAPPAAAPQQQASVQPALTAEGTLKVQRSVIVLLSAITGLLGILLVVSIWSLVYLSDIHALVQMVRHAIDMLGQFGSSGF